jgi:hypothetical protein
VLPCLPLLAEPPHGFTQADRKRRDGLQPLLPAVRHLSVSLSTYFRQQQFSVSQDSRQRIVQLVTQDFAEALAFLGVVGE